jgi:hypothetical protein
LTGLSLEEVIDNRPGIMSKAPRQIQKLQPKLGKRLRIKEKITILNYNRKKNKTTYIIDNDKLSKW